MADGHHPDPWKMVIDQLNRIEANMLTRAEFAAHQQRFDGAISDMHRRVDDVQARSAQTTSEWRAESIAAHKEFDRELDAIRGDIATERKKQQEQASTRRFSVALSALGALLGLISSITVLALSGVIGT